MPTFLTPLTPYLAAIKASLLAAAALCLIGASFYAGYHWEKGNTLAAQKELSDYKAQVAEQAAGANAEAVARLQAEGKVVAGLRTQLADTSSGLRAQSDELQKGLNNATQGEACTLSPAVMQYLNGVRSNQVNPAPAGGAVGVPDAAGGRRTNVPTGTEGP